MDKYLIDLTAEEQGELERLVSKGKAAARKLSDQRTGDKKGKLLGSRGGRKDEAVFSLSLAAYNALGDAEGVELARRDKEPLPCEAPELNPLPLHCY